MLRFFVIDLDRHPLIATLPLHYWSHSLRSSLLTINCLCHTNTSHSVAVNSKSINCRFAINSFESSIRTVDVGHLRGREMGTIRIRDSFLFYTQVDCVSGLYYSLSFVLYLQNPTYQPSPPPSGTPSTNTYLQYHRRKITSSICRTSPSMSYYTILCLSAKAAALFIRIYWYPSCVCVFVWYHTVCQLPPCVAQR